MRRHLIAVGLVAVMVVGAAVVVLLRPDHDSSKISAGVSGASNLDEYAITLPAHTLDFTQEYVSADGKPQQASLHVTYSDSTHWRMETPNAPGAVIFEQDGSHMLRYNENVVDLTKL